MNIGTRKTWIAAFLGVVIMLATKQAYAIPGTFFATNEYTWTGSASSSFNDPANWWEVVDLWNAGPPSTGPDATWNAAFEHQYIPPGPISLQQNTTVNAIGLGHGSLSLNLGGSELTVLTSIIAFQQAELHLTGSQGVLATNSMDMRGGNIGIGPDVTLRVVTDGFASFNAQNIFLNGGDLAAANGVYVGGGENLIGYGEVPVPVAASHGSLIQATGDLVLGDANAYDGFFSDGRLFTGSHTVTINDRNVAVLGSLTELGAGGGTLTAGNANPTDTYAHFLLEQGKNMVGRGSVNGNYKNHGDVIGDGTATAERIIFEDPWIVSGKGAFTNTLILGTFAPGESPGITNGANQGFGGTVEVELGGVNPGFGNENHDQINDTATILLAGSPTLEILPWNSFVPEVGDEFVVLTWQEALDGAFGDVLVDSWFTGSGIDFDLIYNNVGGAGNLTIKATPEPATLSLMALGGLALIRRRKHRDLR